MTMSASWCTMSASSGDGGVQKRCWKICNSVVYTAEHWRRTCSTDSGTPTTSFMAMPMRPSVVMAFAHTSCEVL